MYPPPLGAVFPDNDCPRAAQKIVQHNAHPATRQKVAPSPQGSQSSSASSAAAGDDGTSCILAGLPAGVAVGVTVRPVMRFPLLQAETLHAGLLREVVRDTSGEQKSPGGYTRGVEGACTDMEGECKAGMGKA
eukprot:gene1865-biopygen2844